MGISRRLTAVPPLRSLHGRAHDDLRFIRATMERAARFTCVPGWGGALMGVIALTASPLAALSGTPGRWLAVWLVAACIATAVGVSDMLHKARRERTSLRSGPAARFALGLLPGFAAGAVLSIAFVRLGQFELLPGTWMLLYGAAIASASSFTLASVRWMGLAFLACGALAFATPSSWGDAWMAVSFGGLHAAFGAWIALAPRGEEARDG